MIKSQEYIEYKEAIEELHKIAMEKINEATNNLNKVAEILGDIKTNIKDHETPN